ncbi:MAG: acyl-CoA dehydrogenase family protein [Acidimicrobiia bacterium]|nr:acyl-CoA dehydrogenase family protein [Acidimicrobiia bacterium]
MFGFDLPDEITDAQKLTRDFVANELRPAEAEIDTISDPAEAYTSGKFKEILARSYEMGLHKLTVPEEEGGLGLPPFASYVILEELAAGGGGLASHLLVAPIGHFVIQMFGLAARHPRYKEYAEAFVEDAQGIHSGCWAITEPQVGSDIFTFGEKDIHFRTKASHEEAGSGVTVQRAEGGGFLVNGAKSAFVSNGWYADFILLMAAADADSDMSGTGVFLIPGDLDGISRGRPLDKLGLRALNQAEIYFDDVWVPDEMCIVPAGPMYRTLLEFIVTTGNTSVGLLAVGVARAAFEEALTHAKARAQGGRAIFEHQLVQMKLFDASRRLEASRLMLWKSAWLLTQGRPDLRLAFEARTMASEAVMQITSEMIQVFGGYGISKEYPVEKFYRDAKLLSIMDGTLDRVALSAAERL